MSGITVIVGGQDLSEVACDTLTFSKAYEVGDKSSSWAMPFPKYVVPADYATTSLYDVDSGTEIWRGRFRWEQPEWDGCSGMTQCQPEGLAASMTDEVFHESIVYGPQIRKLAAPPEIPTDLLLGTVVALNIGEAVQHAVGQLCPSISVGTVDGTTLLLEERTRDFFHQNALTVVKYLSGLSAYLSTPFVMKVHNGVFTWTTTPGSVRYTVTLGDGVRMGIRRSPENVVNRVGVGYGRHQGVTSPAVINTGLIGGGVIRDKAVDMTGQISHVGVAQQIGDGVYARGLELKSGWSYSVTIQRAVKVYDNALATFIPAWLMEPGQWLQINSIDNASYSTHPPSTHFITDVSCGKNLAVQVTCGETRAMEDAAAMRWQLAQAEPLKDAVSVTSFPEVQGLSGGAPSVAGPKINADSGSNPPMKIGEMTTIQQPPPHDSGYVGDPRGIDDVYSTQQKLLPQQEAGKPPAASFGISGADLKVGGVKGTINVPPVRLLAWSIDCLELTSFMLRLYQQATGFQIGPDMPFTVGADTVTAGAYTYYTTGYQELTIPLDVVAFDRWAVVVQTPAPGALADESWGTLHLHLARIFPLYPDVIRDDAGDDFIIDVPFGVGKDAA